MTQEEKAKHYDEALKKLKVLHDDWATTQNRAAKEVEEIFPILKESEDERIRKELLLDIPKAFPHDKAFRYIAWLETQGNHFLTHDDENIISQLTAYFHEGKTLRNTSATYVEWLEGLKNRLKEQKGKLVLTPEAYERVLKLGEKKPADKVEPKFHKGDWCIDNEDGTIFQIVKVLDNTYTYKTNEDKEYSCTHYSLENDARLWTIEDAKDGDVLADGNLPFIFKKIDSMMHSYAYCGISVDDGFRISKGGVWTWMQDIKPATKEQCDLLFQKMKEAEYEWDAEKKELKKIEQKPQRVVSAEAKEAMYDKPKWNVSDFRTWQYIVSDVLTKHDGIGQYLDDGFCKKIAKYMQEEWSKKLNIEQKHAELLKGEDYGIDGLYHAIDILERTLGKVNGYQSDDGILEHKIAIDTLYNEISRRRGNYAKDI